MKKRHKNSRAKMREIDKKWHDLMMAQGCRGRTAFVPWHEVELISSSWYLWTRFDEYPLAIKIILWEELPFWLKDLQTNQAQFIARMQKRFEGVG